MKVTAIRSDRIYEKIISAKPEERNDIYRYELMKPFKFKWSCIGIPLKAEQPGGYDVVASSTQGGGYLPSQIESKLSTEVQKISSNELWQTCTDSIEGVLRGFENHGISLPVQEYIFTILLNDPLNPMSKFMGDCCGDGGIPGYIFGTVIPNNRALEVLPAVFSHETNHNVRWQFVKWNSSITLGDLVVSEGLADNFAAIHYGEDKIGKWVTDTNTETLNSVIKPAMKANLGEKDFNRMTAFLYGDEIMALRGVPPVDMPNCAGYACGYHLIRYYLEKTGKNIFEATTIPTEEILQEAEGFWN